MAFQFPWTNFHELNLDWFLSKFKQFTNNYLGTTATAQSVPYGTQPTVTVTGGELDDDTDIVDPFTFNFKIPAGQPGEQGEQGVPGVPGQDGFSPIATVTKSGTVATITITDANGTTTATISDGEVTQAQLDTKAPAILSTASGSIANFSDGADNIPMSELVVGITPSQSGSGDPAPDNIRPISGRTGCNVKRAGKNLLSKMTGVTNINGLTSVGNADGSVTVTGTATGTGGYITTWANLATTIPPRTHITVSTTTNLPGKIRCFWDNATADIQAGTNSTMVAYSTALTKVRLYLSTTANTAYNFTIYPQVEIGTIATAYEEYVAPTTALTVDWTTEAGAVYGGTLDASTGVLTATHALFDMGNASGFTGDSNRPGVYRFSIPGRRSASFVTACSAYLVDNVAVNTNIDNYISGHWSYSGATVFFRDTRLTGYTSAQVKTAVSGYMLTYELATPQTYQLTPQQLFNTLYGVNNVWSDTGDSTVTYTADTKLYIEQLTQPTEDDMVANTSIANGKFFMIGNNLYRATTTIASGSQIIPGSNATALSLADALNLL